MSVISGTIGAVLNSNAQNKATQANAANVNATNNLNYEMFRQSRGAQGNAVLPLYLKDANGNSFESDMGTNAMDLYNASMDGLSPAQQIAMYQAMATQFQPMMAQANTAAEGIFNGQTTGQELANQANTAAVQNQGVQAQKQSNIEGLQQTLNEIKSIQAGQGFSGDSFGSNMMTANAMRSTNTQNAALQSSANISNAQAVQGIKEQGIQRQLSNLNLPSSMTAANINLSNAGQNAAMAQEGQRQQLLSMFRIGTGQFQYQNLPTVQPNAGVGGAIAGGAAAAGGQIGGALLNRGFANNFGAGGGVSSSAAAGGLSTGGAIPGGGGYDADLDPDAVGAGIDTGQVGEYQAIGDESAAEDAL